MWLRGKIVNYAAKRTRIYGKGRTEGLRVDLEASHLDDILSECPAGGAAAVRNGERLAGAGERGRGRGVESLDAAAG